MPTDNKVTKNPVVVACSVITIFENFDSLWLIDAGAADGFQIQDSNGNAGVIPTGIVVNIGGPAGKAAGKIVVIPASGKSLNVTAIVYY